MIGAGPAGSSAARVLASLGWRTALVERGPRHRRKACGHCLNPRANRLLERAGLIEQTRRVAVGRTSEISVNVEHRPPLRASLPSCPRTGAGLLIERHRFDQMLIDHAACAGARVFQPASARLVAEDDGGAVVEVVEGGRRLRARTGLVVGADGLRSPTARAAGLAADGPAGRKYGFALDVRACGWPAEMIGMFVVDGGYLGVVSHGQDRLHLAGLVGAGHGPREPLAFVLSTARRFNALRRVGLDEPHLACEGRLLAAGPIPCRPRRVAAGRVVLAGDAAGYSEPFSGEGISWALECAETLRGIAAGLRPGVWTAEAARRYRHGWAATVGRRQLLGWGLGAALERPRLARALHLAGRRSPAVAGWLVRRAAMP